MIERPLWSQVWDSTSPMQVCSSSILHVIQAEFPRFFAYFPWISLLPPYFLYLLPHEFLTLLSCSLTHSQSSLLGAPLLLSLLYLPLPCLSFISVLGFLLLLPQLDSRSFKHSTFQSAYVEHFAPLNVYKVFYISSMSSTTTCTLSNHRFYSLCCTLSSFTLKLFPLLSIRSTILFMRDQASYLVWSHLCHKSMIPSHLFALSSSPRKTSCFHRASSPFLMHTTHIAYSHCPVIFSPRWSFLVVSPDMYWPVDTSIFKICYQFLPLLQLMFTFTWIIWSWKLWQEPLGVQQKCGITMTGTRDTPMVEISYLVEGTSTEA